MLVRAIAGAGASLRAAARRATRHAAQLSTTVTVGGVGVGLALACDKPARCAPQTIVLEPLSLEAHAKRASEALIAAAIDQITDNRSVRLGSKEGPLGAALTKEFMESFARVGAVESAPLLKGVPKSGLLNAGRTLRFTVTDCFFCNGTSRTGRKYYVLKSDTV